MLKPQKDKWHIKRGTKQEHHVVRSGRSYTLTSEQNLVLVSAVHTTWRGSTDYAHMHTGFPILFRTWKNSEFDRGHVNSNIIFPFGKKPKFLIVLDYERLGYHIFLVMCKYRNSNLFKDVVRLAEGRNWNVLCMSTWSLPSLHTTLKPLLADNVAMSAKFS